MSLRKECIQCLLLCPDFMTMTVSTKEKLGSVLCPQGIQSITVFYVIPSNSSSLEVIDFPNDLEIETLH